MDKSEIIKKSYKVGELYKLSELLSDNRLSEEQKMFVCSRMVDITKDVENFLKRFSKGVNCEQCN